jgi:hypothetical protein
MKKLNICGEKLHPPIDTKSDAVMVKEGIRVPKLTIDRKCWEKSQEEKDKLKKVKNKLSPTASIPRPKNVEKKKLIVYFLNESKTNRFRTTESVMCEHLLIADVIERLRRVYIKETKQVVIRKPVRVFYDGKLYRQY